LAADVSREHVSDFITHLLATRSASTASVRFRALHQLFTWLVDEEEIARSGGRAAVASGFGWALDAVEVAASRQNFRLCR
jgi:hypothetical protein